MRVKGAPRWDGASGRRQAGGELTASVLAADNVATFASSSVTAFVSASNCCTALSEWFLMEMKALLGKLYGG